MRYSSAKTFTKAIKPLKISDKVHIFSLLNTAPEAAAAEKIKKNNIDLFPKMYWKALKPQYDHPITVQNANIDISTARIKSVVMPVTDVNISDKL